MSANVLQQIRNSQENMAFAKRSKRKTGKSKDMTGSARVRHCIDTVAQRLHNYECNKNGEIVSFIIMCLHILNLKGSH